MKILGIVMRLEKLDDAYKWFINKTYIDVVAQYQWAIFPIADYTSLSCAQNVCDALLVPGGYDIHSYYLHAVYEYCGTYYDSFMDHFDLACIDAFYQVNKPILGICRGMQMLNCYFKGTIIQHIDTALHEHSHIHNITQDEHSHNFLQGLYPHEFPVNSFHHQVVDQLGESLQSAAFSKDDYVEAIEHINHKIIGVQWHPERMENDQIFPYFLDIVCA